MRCARETEETNEHLQRLGQCKVAHIVVSDGCSWKYTQRSFDLHPYTLKH